MGLWDSWRVGILGSALFDIKSDILFVTASFLELYPSPTESVTKVESLRGRPRLRFGERGALSSSLGKVGGWGEFTVFSGSGTLGGVLGGRPLFLFTGAVLAFTLASVEVEVVSFSGGASIFLGWFPPLPLPRCCCCSPSWAAMRDSVSSLRRTGRFLSTGMSGERWGGEYGG